MHFFSPGPPRAWPSLRAASAPPRRPLGRARLRILVALDDRDACRATAAALSRDFPTAIVAEAADVPSAAEALLVRHPDVVVTELELGGHAQRGLRLVIDAVSIGVPTIVVGSGASAASARKLDGLGVLRVAKSARARGLASAVEAALAARAELSAARVSASPIRARAV